jgi:hypothetical protein
MRRLATMLAALSLMAFAGTALAGGGGAPPPFPRLGGAWYHVTINQAIKKTQHTLILDRGRIVQVSPSQLMLRERDGTTPVIALSQSTIVVVDGVPSTVLDLKKRMDVQTMRIDGGAAVRVRATSF